MCLASTVSNRKLWGFGQFFFFKIRIATSSPGKNRLPRTSIESAELAERPNQKTIRFFSVLHPRHHPRVFFGVFSFRGPSACYSVFFGAKIVAFILRVPLRPLLQIWAEHAFLALFQSWGLALW